MPQERPQNQRAAEGPWSDDLDSIDRAAADSFPASDAPAAGGPAADPTISPKKEHPPRVQVQRFLGGVEYPADKRTLVEAARRAGADQSAIETLQGLPQDRFNSTDEVSEAVGKPT